MWLIPTKKEVKKELEKIQTAFKERDIKQSSLYEQIKKDYSECLADIKELRHRIENDALKIATLEGFILNKSQVSISTRLKPSQETFETKLIQRIRNNKKALVMAEIAKLGHSMPISELFNKIVREKGLCSKASFYRYIESLKSQGLETNKETSEIIETKHKRTNES